MKKLISLLAAVSVVSACSLAAFATDYTVDYGNSNTSNMPVTDATTPTEYTVADGVYTFNLANVNGVENTQAQTTILAVKGTTISVGSIQYINQSSGKSFSFALKDPLTEDVNVLVGGSSIQPTKVSTIEAPVVSTGYTVSGTVANFVTQDFYDESLIPCVDEIFGGEGKAEYLAAYATTAYLVNAEDTTAIEEFMAYYVGEADTFTYLAKADVSAVDGSFSFSEVADGRYALIVTRDGALPYMEYANVEGANVNAGTITMITGDLIGAKDYLIDSGDLALMVDSISEIGEDNFVPSYDIAYDCLIDSGDLAEAVSNIGDITAYETDLIADYFG